MDAEQENGILDVLICKVYRATAGTFDETKAAVTRNINTANDTSHYLLQRITGGTVTDSHFKIKRNLYQTAFFDHSRGQVLRQTASFEDHDFNTLRIAGYYDEARSRIGRKRVWEDTTDIGILRVVGHEDNTDNRITVNVANVDPGIGSVCRQVCIEEGYVATATNILLLQERSVWAVERGLYHTNEKSVHSVERQVMKNTGSHIPTEVRVANIAKSYHNLTRNLYGTANEYFPVSRNIVVANERSAYFIIRREIVVEQERYNTIRHISTGKATGHFHVALTPIIHEETRFPVSKRVTYTENSYWLTIRQMGKTPEEYFGKACIFRSNVNNLVLSPEMVDANIALDKVYSDKEALLEIAMQRDDVHDALNLHGNITKFHDGKLVYYPPLNSQSTVLIVPNWNTSEEMAKECREKNMVVEAHKVNEKHYKLHVRFDEPPACPLYFSIVVMNPDRTVIDDGFPTVINMITAKDYTPEQLKQLSSIVNMAEE